MVQEAMIRFSIYGDVIILLTLGVRIHEKNNLLSCIFKYYTYQSCMKNVIQD